MANNLIFITSTVSHKKFRDRLDAAMRAGYDVKVIGYCRDREIKNLRSDDSDRVNYFLVNAPSKMGAFSRIPFLLKLIAKIISVRFTYGKPSVILVNTAELLLLSSVLFIDKIRGIYDLADINPIQYGDGCFSNLFRLAEARILNSQKWDIVVTSPWFCWGYLRPVLRSGADCYLIENKLIGRADLPASSSSKCFDHKSPLTIGWTGLLRCNRSLGVLFDLCKFNARVNLDLIGSVRTLDGNLLDLANSLSNIRILGEYLEEKLADKLTDVHFIWACDFFDGLNSKFLLPNRLYQGIFYGKPLIAEAGTATGYVVDYYDIGMVLEDFSAVNLSAVLSGITQEKYDKWRANCIRMSDRVLRGMEWRDFLRTSGQQNAQQIGDEVDVSIVMRRGDS